MFKIHRKVEYALIALKHMHTKPQGQLTSAKEICAAYGTPFDALSRVLQILTHQGVLRSEHGAHGGYHIQRDLARVSFLELAEGIVGPVALVDCLSTEDPECDLSPTCAIASPIVRLNKRVKEFYGTISVRELIERAESQPRKAQADREIAVRSL